MPRATQTEEFWRDDFSLTDRDESKLQEYFLQRGTPLPPDELARQLVLWQVGDSGGGDSSHNGQYNPTHRYEVGQKITFPSVEGELGEILETRAGQNPNHSSFTVLRVRFPARNETREFASDLRDFVLREAGESNEPLLSADEIFERFGPYVLESVEWALSRSPNFVRYGERWLPTLMLVTFHEGHLNIADAMIDVMGTAMTPAELLTEMPTTEEASDEVKRFSLNHTLSQDKRFVNQGTNEQPHWYLVRLG